MRGSAIEVTRVAGLATVQDAGRPGRMHEGIPPGGPLVPEGMARANAAAGNAPGTAAIELVGSLAVVARDGAVTIATDDGEVRTLAPGEAHRVEASGTTRVKYVAVRGGIDVPVVLGGRGTLLVAGFGGVEGRGLRRGDVVGVGGAVAVAVGGAGGGGGGGDGGGDGAPVGVRIGPDEERFTADAIATLLSAPFVFSALSDRTGTRLSGPRLARIDADDARSAPMVAGAVEVPASGDPIVLGPDHPTTGGYPVIAVIVRADLGRFHALPVGSPVRFARAGRV